MKRLLAVILSVCVFAVSCTQINVNRTEAATALPTTVQLAATYTYAEMCQDINELCAAYPGIVTSASCGVSGSGTNIPYLIVGNPSAPHSIMIQASIHAREYIATQVTMAIVEYYAKQFATGGLADVYASTCFYVVPMANPDGVSIAQMINKDWKANGNGVDLNRNFPTYWEMTPSPASPGSKEFKGYSAASESETRALMGLATARNHSCYISYHQQGNVIYYDDDFATPTVSALSALLAQNIASINRYTLVNAKSGASTNGVGKMGGFNDWIQLTLQKPGVTVECGSAYGAAGQGQAASIYQRNAATWAQVARVFGGF
ncbi:MAG: hypothetical protein K6G22_05250 [Lachnospiraceae bacterium]|nr:hypothetical protein [Lachnospiraceae bacterium]